MGFRLDEIRICCDYFDGLFKIGHSKNCKFLDRKKVHYFFFIFLDLINEKPITGENLK